MTIEDVRELCARQAEWRKMKDSLCASMHGISEEQRQAHNDSCDEIAAEIRALELPKEGQYFKGIVKIGKTDLGGLSPMERAAKLGYPGAEAGDVWVKDNHDVVTIRDYDGKARLSAYLPLVKEGGVIPEVPNMSEFSA